jgi:hypothetical protein
MRLQQPHQQQLAQTDNPVQLQLQWLVPGTLLHIQQR